MKKIFLLLSLTLFAYTQERIIALSPAINEIIFALGAGEEIVANTDYALYPKASVELPKVGGYFSPNLEKIVALKPTVVIMQNNNYKLSLKLQRLGIKTKVIKIDRLKSIKRAIQEIGQLLKREKEAEAILLEIEDAIKEIKGIVIEKKILIVFGSNTDLSRHIFVAGQNLYFDDIINESNNSNALQSKRKGQPILAMENIIACNPDMVLLLAHNPKSPSDKELIEPWLKLPISASHYKAIYINRESYAGIPSNRLILFLKDFKTMLQHYKKSIHASHQ